MRATTLREIASEAGVSIGTVSRILQGKLGRISSDTQRAVETIAARRGYRPNVFVRSLQTGRSRLVGLVAPPVNPFWSEIIYGAHDYLFEHDYVPLIFWTPRHGGGTNTVRKMLLTLMDWQVDGVIFWPQVAHHHKEEIEALRRRSISITTVENVVCEAPSLTHVGCDDQAGGAAAADYLFDLGHRNVVFAGSGTGPAPWWQDRRDGFARRCEELGMSHVAVTGRWSDEDYTRGYTQLTEALGSRSRPTAVFAACDPIGVHCLRHIKRLGLRVPEEISVLGFGGELTQETPLTTFVVDPYELGRKAAETTIQRSAGGEDTLRPVRVLVPAVLREAGTVRRLAVPPTV